MKVFFITDIIEHCQGDGKKSRPIFSQFYDLNFFEIVK